LIYLGHGYSTYSQHDLLGQFSRELELAAQSKIETERPHEEYVLQGMGDNDIKQQNHPQKHISYICGAA